MDDARRSSGNGDYAQVVGRIPLLVPWFDSPLLAGFGIPLALTLLGVLAAHLLDGRRARKQVMETKHQNEARLQRTLVLLMDEVVRRVDFVTDQAMIAYGRSGAPLDIEEDSHSLWPDLKEILLTSELPPNHIRDLAAFFSLSNRLHAESAQARRHDIEAADAWPGGDGQRLREAETLRSRAIVNVNAYLLTLLGGRIVGWYGTPAQKAEIQSNLDFMNGATPPDLEPVPA